MAHDPRELLTRLGLSDAEAKTYKALVEGAQTARALVKATGQKRPTVYYALGCLERRGLVLKSGTGSGLFELASPEHLAALAEERAVEAAALAASVRESLPLFTPRGTAADTRPSVTFFEGKEAVARMIGDLLYAKGRAIDILAPQDNFFRQTGTDFLKRFIEERQKRRIRTRSLWDAPITKDVYKKYYEGLSEVRIVPEAMRGSFATSVFLSGDETLYVSSLKNSHAIRISSKEHHDTMRAWFDAIWAVSREHRGR